jgi:hypothetical protein
MIIIVFVCCNSEEENIKLNQGLNFEEINKNPSQEDDSHQGCIAPCCLEGK